MPGFYNSQGQVEQLPLHVGMYREAAEAGMSLAQYININHPTDNAEARGGSTFQQLMASEGIFVTPNREYGIRSSTLDQIVNGNAGNMSAGTIVKDQIPTSRILFPAVIMQAIEDKLLSSLTMTANAFDSLIGYEESISGERYEYPVLNFDKPSAARSMGVSQLAQPPSMLTITTSERAFKIPTFALGLEVSDQALKQTTIDFLALSLARQAAVERNERAGNFIMAILNGDIDNNDGSIASKGYMYNASTFDSAATGGVLTQKAWMKYLMKDGTKRTLTHLITTVDTALKIEGRTGKPTIVQDDGTTNRFDTQFNVMNPTWAKNPQLFLLDESAGVPTAAWPANTILGLDKAWAIRRVRNLSANYQGIESYVMRRSTQMRFDFGEHVNRMYDEAFGGLVLA